MRAASGDTPTNTSIGTAGDYTVPPDLLPAYKAAAEKYGVPVELLIAQHKQESNLSPGATGGAGEVGLGQILPATAKSPGFGMAGADPKALRDPAANIDFSAQYLAARAKAAGADLRTPEGVVKALKAYNGGGDPNYVQNVTRYIPGAQKALRGQRADAAPEAGTVQTAGDAAPTSGVIPTLPPQAAAASAADVAQIEAGRAEARTSMAGGSEQGTMVAGPPGTVPPAMPPAPEFKMRPLTPTEQAQTSYALDPKVQRNINALKAGAYTTEMMKAALVEESNAIAAQRTKADAARLTIESKAREDWQKQTSPATDAHLAAAGMMREPGVQYLVDNAGNVSTKEIPVDPRARQASMDENKRYQENYAGPYDKIRPVHQLLDQMEALDKKIKSDSLGGRGTVGSNFAQSVQKTLSGLGLASDSITDATANQEAYNALHNQLVLKLKGLSGTSLGNMSNTDLAFLDNSAPAMNTTPGGRMRTTTAIRQILSYQSKLYDAATDVIHDPSGGYTLRDLNKKIAEVPPAIPTFPGRNASAADAKAWMEHNKPRRGTAYYNSKGDLAIWGVDPLE